MNYEIFKAAVTVAVLAASFLLLCAISKSMAENYSIKTGRENTGVTGFSMGGREALYV